MLVTFQIKRLRCSGKRKESNAIVMRRNEDVSTSRTLMIAILVRLVSGQKPVKFLIIGKDNRYPRVARPERESENLEKAKEG